MAPPAARVSVLLALALAPRASLWIAGVNKANAGQGRKGSNKHGYMAGTPYTHTHTHIYICICIYIYVCIHTSKLFVLYYGIMFYFVMLYLPNVNPAVVHLQHATVNFGAGSQHDRSVRPLRSRIPRQLFSETLCSSCARKFDSEGMPCGVKTCQPLSTAAALVRRMTPVAQVKSRKDRHRHIS